MDNERSYNFGEALSEIMKEREIKQVTLVNDTGLSKGYISQIINGQRQPDIESLSKICRALNISLSYFILYSLNYSKNEKTNQLLESIMPTLWELEKLINPDNDSDNKDDGLPNPVNVAKNAYLEVL